MLRHRLPVALTIGCTALALTSQAAAAPSYTGPSDRTPTAQARAAGVTAPGQAYAGWSKDAQQASASTHSAQRMQPHAAATQTLGIDVSSYQGNVDWAYWWGQGVRWAYTKATEGTYYTNPYFGQQYTGSYNQGMIRGAYHFATPNTTSGAVQANYFVDHGGGWSPDGQTLPGMVDLETNPYGAKCYGLSQSQMVDWIASFSNTYRDRTGRDVVIYTSRSWWQECTGNTTAFSQTNPLDFASWGSSPGTLPGGWSYYTFWQFTDSPVDQNWFNGDLSRLKALALG